MRRLVAATFLPLLLAIARPTCLVAQEIPHLDRGPGSTQLIVGGRPFIIFGGELGNSSAGTAAQADRILPQISRAHINTVLMPMAWEQVEPVEGKFDFIILDHWIEQARIQHIHLVLLSFGSWKNGFSSYAPDWVKKDPKRFPRAMAPDGRALEILSTLSKENLDADAHAFRALMRHLKESDGQQQTVLMAQVENEVGILGSGRDHSAEAERLFNGPIPESLMQYLRAHPDWFRPELARAWNLNEHNWRGVFGDSAPETFMAWNYARFIGQVVAAGKNEYPLPMFVNAQLPAPPPLPSISFRLTFTGRISNIGLSALVIAVILCSCRKQNSMPALSTLSTPTEKRVHLASRRLRLTLFLMSKQRPTRARNRIRWPRATPSYKS